MIKKEIQISEIELLDRDRKDYGKVDELAESISRLGLIQPISVMEKEDKTGFILVAGGRRLQAHKDLNKTTIEALIRPFSKDMINFKEIELEENVQRKNLTPFEECEAKLRLNELKISIYGEKKTKNPDDPGWSPTDTANLMGVERSGLRKDLKVAEAIRENPELAEKYKTKNEVLNHIKKEATKKAESKLAAYLEQEDNKKLVDEVKQNLIDAYIVGDFLTESKYLNDGFAHLVEFDPPYCIQPMAYAINTTEEERKNLYTPEDEKDFETVQAYHTFIENFHKRIYEIMSPDSWLINWTSYDWAQFMKDSLIKTGFKVSKTPGFWVKPIGVTTAPEYNLGSCVEMFWYARKGNAKIRLPGRGNTFIYSGVSKKSHPTERPIEMIQDVMSIFAGPGSIVVCPCAGSGNTLLAAKNLKMLAVGYDISESYLDHYKTRVHLEVPGQYKSYKVE